MCDIFIIYNIINIVFNNRVVVIKLAVNCVKLGVYVYLILHVVL